MIETSYGLLSIRHIPFVIEWTAPNERYARGVEFMLDAEDVFSLTMRQRVRGDAWMSYDKSMFIALFHAIREVLPSFDLRRDGVIPLTPADEVKMTMLMDRYG